MLTAGLFLQLTGSMHASSPNLNNYADAFMQFAQSIDSSVNDIATAANTIYNNRNTQPTLACQELAQQLNTAEALAVGLYLSKGQPEVSFRNADSLSNLNIALAGIMNNRPTPIMADPTPSNPAPAPVKSGSGSWFTWGSATPTSTPADIQAAMKTQQQADAAKAAADLQSLSAIVNSNASGVSLYNAYVDVIVNNLQQALSSIDDPAVKQQVVSYAKNKLSNMQASVSVNSHNSRALGRMSSKKAMKKNKHSRSYAA